MVGWRRVSLWKRGGGEGVGCDRLLVKRFVAQGTWLYSLVFSWSKLLFPSLPPFFPSRSVSVVQTKTAFAKLG